jgi:hypothetical protein
MEESVGEVQRVGGGIAMLPVLEIAFEDGRKLGIIKESMSQRIQQ